MYLVPNKREFNALLGGKKAIKSLPQCLRGIQNRFLKSHISYIKVSYLLQFSGFMVLIMANPIIILIFNLSYEIKCRNSFQNTLPPLLHRAQCKITHNCALCVCAQRVLAVVCCAKIILQSLWEHLAEFFKNPFEYYSKTNPWINMKFGTCLFCTIFIKI